MVGYATGKLTTKTLQPKAKYISAIDTEVLKQDWRENSISEKTLRCLDPTFFDEETIVSSRHGIYAMSSKEWNNIKDKVEEESKLIKEQQFQEMTET